MGKRGPVAKNKLPVAEAAPMPTKEHDRWRAEDDLRTMQRANEVMSDKSRLKAAKAVAKEQMDCLKKIAK